MSLPEPLFKGWKSRTLNPMVQGTEMKRDEKMEESVEEANADGPVDDSIEEAFKKASEIEHIDDSELPQSIKDLFKR